MKYINHHNESSDNSRSSLIRFDLRLIPTELPSTSLLNIKKKNSNKKKKKYSTSTHKDNHEANGHFLLSPNASHKEIVSVDLKMI